MGSGSSSKNKTASPSEPPSTSKAPSPSSPPSPNERPEEDSKPEGKPSPHPHPPAASDPKKAGSSSSSASLEPSQNSPPQTTERSVPKQKQGAGSSVLPVPPKSGEGAAVSAESSSSPPSSSKEGEQGRKPEEPEASDGERGAEKKDTGKTASVASLKPAATTITDRKKKESSEEVRKTMAEDKRLVPEVASEHQRRLDTSLRVTNALVRQDGLMAAVHCSVSRLALKRALPPHVSLGSLVAKVDSLQVLDVSDNELGPQGVRLLCLALSADCPVVSLSLAGNKTDTDTAESLGRLLTRGPPVEYLDISSNYLGKDFFSRCAGKALRTNSTLTMLRAQSIGMVDARVLLEGLQENSTLVELDLSNNQITDRQALGSALAAVLKKGDCSLQSLALAGCNMSGQGLSLLTEGLATNTSLSALNLNNNEFGSLQTLMSTVVAAFCHPGLTNLHLNDARITDTALTDVPPPANQNESSSQLEVLSLSSSRLTEELWVKVAAAFPGRLRNLLDVDISNNDKLTATVVQHLWTLSADDSGRSGLLKLTTAMNDMNTLPAHLTAARFPHLAYLNTRKVRFSPDAFCALADLVGSSGGPPLTTLVLDGIKLSGKKGLTALLGNLPSNGLTALSLGGCSLNDADLTPLTEVMGSGVNLHMLKLSANRLTDVAVKGMVGGLLKSLQHPLGVLDMCENQITDVGATELCRLYTTKGHSSSLHSVNLASNTIGKEGILCLLSCMGAKLPLKCLYVNNQSAAFLEADTEELYVKVASVLGYTVKRSGETIETGCSDLPSLPDGLAINLRGLGGHAGELGPYLDCPAIVTHASSQSRMTLTLENVLDICASLQGQKGGAPCTVSKEDWVHIVGADKDNSIPSWLQLAEGRNKGVYLSNLPGNSTSQRLEALFETEADCNIEEVFLVKDPVTRNNAGTAWVLFSDQPSVDRAIQLYSSGQAQVFGTPFTISRLKVNVEESASSEASDEARRDLAARQKARAAEDRAHRQLIQQNTEESWKRHAYRLAHPAYADGRIW